MAKEKGHVQWFIPDGYIPPDSSGDLTSHESICVLNCNQEDVNLLMTVYFEDRDPIENIQVSVQARRTNHVRTSSLESGGQKIPHGVPYAVEIESDLPVIIQYSRLDSTQAELALLSTMAYPMGK
ncbi:sensory rhodopsin transducer [Sediminibacillus massiliensis]|uniref:sensory rhodopsin transducer n=1 Tax=Sediminibacillus massiliensis TaxID=1926277 RepID=UPI00098867D0|nr:sensory rhodopsin transducer [Sediminibacillus massiliensis]